MIRVAQFDSKDQNYLNYFFINGTKHMKNINSVKSYLFISAMLISGTVTGCASTTQSYEFVDEDSQVFQESSSYYEKVCNSNQADRGMGCNNLGIYYETGHGIKQSFEEAKNYFEKACTLKYDQGCSNLGVLYFNGMGVDQDKTLAKEYYGRACDLGNQEGCDKYRKLDEKGY